MRKTPLWLRLFVWVVVASVFALLLRAAWKLEEARSKPPVIVVDPLADSLKRRVLFYSAHARERMIQRKISEADVEVVKTTGAVNWRKSANGVYALEAVVGNRRLRVVLAPHTLLFATVVTVISIEEYRAGGVGAFWDYIWGG